MFPWALVIDAIFFFSFLEGELSEKKRLKVLYSKEGLIRSVGNIVFLQKRFGGTTKGVGGLIRVRYVILEHTRGAN